MWYTITMYGLLLVACAGAFALWQQQSVAETTSQLPMRLSGKLDRLWEVAQESLRDRRYLRAEKALLTILRVDERNATAYNRLGILYAKQKAFDDAIECFEIAQSLEPSASSLHNVGLIYYETKRYDKAALAFEQALAMEDKLAARHIAYAKVQEKLGHSKKMLESLERAAKLEPGTQTYQLLAEGYERAGDHKKAQRIRAKIQPQPTSAQSPQHHQAQPEPHQQSQQRITVPSQQVEQQPSTAYYHPPAALPAPAAPAYTQAPPQPQPNAAYSRQSSTVHPPARAPMPANRIQRSAPRRITM